MTVIAWDGTTLAADRQASNAGITYAVTKVYRAGPDVLCAIAGNLARGLAMMRWWEQGRDPTTFPKAGDRNEQYATLLVIHRDGRIERYESEPWPLIVESLPHALGSGREFALMAMHLGKDAREAVSATCALSTECGVGIDVLRFE